MNNILNLVEELKDLIINSDEYKKYIHDKDIIDNNTELKKIISEIKIKQKIIVNKKYKKESIDREEFELKNLFEKLEKNNDYINYIKSARIINNLITDIQKKFEKYFNEFVI